MAKLDEKHEESSNQSHTYQIEIPHSLRKRGVEAKLVIQEENIRSPEQDQNLIKLIAKSHLWLQHLTIGTATSISDLAIQQNEDPTEVSRFLPLAFLAPDITESIMAGTQPPELTIETLRKRTNLPINWEDQKSALGFNL